MTMNDDTDDVEDADNVDHTDNADYTDDIVDADTDTGGKDDADDGNNDMVNLATRCKFLKNSSFQ